MWASCLIEMSGGSRFENCVSSVKDAWGYLENNLSQTRKLEEDFKRQAMVKDNSTCKQHNVTVTNKDYYCQEQLHVLIAKLQDRENYCVSVTI